MHDDHICYLYDDYIFLKTKKLSYSNEATDFHNKENPEAGSVYNWLAAI